MARLRDVAVCAKPKQISTRSKLFQIRTMRETSFRIVDPKSVVVTHNVKMTTEIKVYVKMTTEIKVFVNKNNLICNSRARSLQLEASHVLYVFKVKQNSVKLHISSMNKFKNKTMTEANRSNTRANQGT